MNDNEIREIACRTLNEMSALLGWELTCSIADNGENGAFKLIVNSDDDASAIIGRKGQGLDALELLINRIVKAKHEDAAWIPVEVNGYSTGRTGEHSHPHRDGGDHGGSDAEMQERFASIAQSTAKEVRYWKEPRRIGPYTPAERRIIHNTLKEDPAVETESIPAPEAGERMKYVVIKLK